MAVLSCFWVSLLAVVVSCVILSCLTFCCLVCLVFVGALPRLASRYFVFVLLLIVLSCVPFHSRKFSSFESSIPTWERFVYFVFGLWSYIIIRLLVLYYSVLFSWLKPLLDLSESLYIYIYILLFILSVL